MQSRNGAGRHPALDELVQAHLAGRLSRRQVIARAGALGISAAAIGALLGTRPALAQQGGTPTAQEGSPEPLQLGTYDGRTLRVSVALSEVETPVVQEIASNFGQLTNGTVELVNIEAANVINTLRAQVESGNVQLDLLAQDNNQLAPLVAEGLVEAIPNAEEIMPAETIEALKEVLRFDGTYYFLPARPNVQIAYFNENQFNQLGVQPPQTWDELLAVGQTIREQAGVGKIALQGATGGPVGVTVTQFLWQAGADPLQINTPEAATAFQFLRDLQPSLTPQYPTGDFNTLNTWMLNESAVLAQNWPFGVTVVVQEGGKEEVKTYAGWSGPAGNFLVLGGDVFGVAKGTPNVDMALDFTHYFMSREVQERLTAELGWPAMRTDAFGAVAEWQQPYFETIREALQHTRPRPNVTYWGQVEQILSNAFNDIVTGGAPVQETLDRYQQEIDQAAAGA